MSTERTLNALLYHINDNVSVIEQAVNVGLPIDFPEYKRLCGELKAYYEMRQYINDLKDHDFNSDD